MIFNAVDVSRFIYLVQLRSGRDFSPYDFEIEPVEILTGLDVAERLRDAVLREDTRFLMEEGDCEGAELTLEPDEHIMCDNFLDDEGDVTPTSVKPSHSHHKPSASSSATPSIPALLKPGHPHHTSSATSSISTPKPYHRHHTPSVTSSVQHIRDKVYKKGLRSKKRIATALHSKAQTYRPRSSLSTRLTRPENTQAKFDAGNLPAAQGAYVGKPQGQHAESPRTVEQLTRLGLALHKWDGR